MDDHPDRRAATATAAARRSTRPGPQSAERARRRLPDLPDAADHADAQPGPAEADGVDRVHRPARDLLRRRAAGALQRPARRHPLGARRRHLRRPRRVDRPRGPGAGQGGLRRRPGRGRLRRRPTAPTRPGSWSRTTSARSSPALPSTGRRHRRPGTAPTTSATALPHGRYGFAIESYEGETLLGTQTGTVYATVTEVRVADGQQVLVSRTAAG